MSLDAIVDQIIRELRDGPCTFRMLKTRLRIDDRKLDRALQKAKPEIEYSKAKGDSRKLWRVVERRPKRKVGKAVAEVVCYGEPSQFRGAFDRSHALGFGDGQRHAFQLVAEIIRQKADLIPHRKTAAIALKWADEIASGAWAEEEAGDA